jgi:hypothetical protein
MRAFVLSLSLLCGCTTVQTFDDESGASYQYDKPRSVASYTFLACGAATTVTLLALHVVPWVIVPAIYTAGGVKDEHNFGDAVINCGGMLPLFL